MNDLNRRTFMGGVAALFGAAYLPRVDVSAATVPMLTEAQRGFWGVHSYSCNTSFEIPLNLIDKLSLHEPDELNIDFDCILYAEEDGRQVEHKLWFACGEKEWVVTEETQMFKPRPYRSHSVMSDVAMPPYYESQDLEFWKSGTKNVASIYDMAKSQSLSKNCFDIVVRFSSGNDPNFFKGDAAYHKNVMRLNKCMVTNWNKKIYPPNITRKGKN